MRKIKELEQIKDSELLEILKVCERQKENTRHCILSNGRQDYMTSQKDGFERNYRL